MMNQREIDGVLVTRPTRADVESLSVGDLAPDVFGRMAPVSEVFARGDDINGRAYACYYTRFGERGGISGSIKEGEPVGTVPATSKWHTTTNYPNW
ncbi:MAG: hypothetical protein ABFD89_06290 [Bryobacteraceae bacterium]